MTQGEWVWITKHMKPSEKPEFNWQSRDVVTPDMEAFVQAAWRNHDNSDSSDTPILHDEAVLARFAMEEIYRYRDALTSAIGRIKGREYTADLEKIIGEGFLK